MRICKQTRGLSALVHRCAQVVRRTLSISGLAVAALFADSSSLGISAVFPSSLTVLLLVLVFSGDSKLAAIGARKVLERRPLNQLALPTRTMLSRCGEPEVSALIRRFAEEAFVFHMSVWIARTKLHRRRMLAVVRFEPQLLLFSTTPGDATPLVFVGFLTCDQNLIARSWRWYRFKKWGREVGRKVKQARAVLQV
jgi:hypothetical protein